MSKHDDEGMPSRRRFLQKTLSLIPLAAASSGVVAFTSPEAHSAATDEGVSAYYVPIFFNNDEWRFLLAATDRLIPADENGPGAVREGVPVFIDKQMELPYGYGHLWYMQPPFADAIPKLAYQSSLIPRETYRCGTRAVNDHCQRQFQKAFTDLTARQQDSLLSQLESGKLTFANVPGALFLPNCWITPKKVIWPIRCTAAIKRWRHGK